MYLSYNESEVAIMKAPGTSAITSFLTFLLNTSWYTVACVLSLTVLLVVLSPFADNIPGLTMIMTVTRGPDFTIDTPYAGEPGLKMTIPVSFAVDPQTHRVSAPSLGIANAQIRAAHGLLRFPVRNGFFFVGNAVVLIVMLTLALFVLGELRAVFRTLRDGQPFVPANATRIRRIGALVIASEIARSAVMLFESFYASTHFAADGLRFDVRPDVNGLAIVNGLIILAIAEVFRAGTRLDEEQSLTV